MTLLQNTAESGLAAGTTVTVGNSGGTAGDAFTSVVGSATFDTTAAMRGTRGYRFSPSSGSSAYVAWTSVSGGTNAFAFRVKFKVPSLPSSSSQPLIYVYSGTSTGIFAVQLDTSGTGAHLFVTSDVAGGARQGSSMTASVVAGHAYELEVYGNNSTSSQLHLRLYETDGTTAVPGGSLDITSPSIGSSTINTVRVGRPAGVSGAFTVYVDDVAFQTGSATPIGPPVIDGTVSGATAKATAKAFAGSVPVGATVDGSTAVVLVTAQPTGIDAYIIGVTPTVSAAAPAGVVVWPHLAMTVTPEPDATPPRVRISIVDTRVSPATSMTISRRNPDGRTSSVRTFDDGPLALSGGVATIYDYEVPFGQDVTYTTSVTNGPTATTRLESADVWMVHLGVPSRSVLIPTVVSHDEDERDANRGLFQVLEREKPLPVTSGARQAPSGTLVVRTRTDGERVALGLLLSDSSVVLLNVPPDKQWGVDTDYISIGNTAPKRLVNYGRFPARNWPLPYQVVDRPAGGTQAGRVWDTLTTEGYTTWDAVTTDFDTWSEVTNPTT